MPHLVILVSLILSLPIHSSGRGLEKQRTFHLDNPGSSGLGLTEGEALPFGTTPQQAWLKDGSAVQRSFELGLLSEEEFDVLRDLNPYYLGGDFDGDGLTDGAFWVKKESRSRLE